MKESDLNIPKNYIHEERCSDGICCFRNPEINIGMQTNGGCHCLRDLEIGKRQAIKVALREFYKYANKEQANEPA